MSRYSLSADAGLDLDEIWEYIATDNIDAADRWIAKLFDAFETLARTPNIGHTRQDLTAFPVLFWAVGAYLIIYLAHKRPVEIVAVTQGFPRHPIIPAIAALNAGGALEPREQPTPHEPAADNSRHAALARRQCHRARLRLPGAGGPPPRSWTRTGGAPVRTRNESEGSASSPG